jgi:hypothetical protein
LGTRDEALRYDNPDVIRRFRRSFAVTQDEAEDIFEETKSWLWFAAHAQHGEAFINESMWVIDEMWHTFILFTVEYAAYCERHFGRFLHHGPITGEDHPETPQMPLEGVENARSAQAERLRAQFLEIERLLGMETLLKWQVDFRTRYSPEACRALAMAALAEDALAQARMEATKPTPPAVADGGVSTDEIIDDVEAIVRLALAPPNQIPKCDISCGGFRCVCNRLVP